MQNLFIFAHKIIALFLNSFFFLIFILSRSARVQKYEGNQQHVAAAYIKMQADAVRVFVSRLKFALFRRHDRIYVYVH